jgi:hypothetical protein
MRGKGLSVWKGFSKPGPQNDHEFLVHGIN